MTVPSPRLGSRDARRLLLPWVKTILRRMVVNAGTNQPLDSDCSMHSEFNHLDVSAKNSPPKRDVYHRIVP